MRNYTDLSDRSCYLNQTTNSLQTNLQGNVYQLSGRINNQILGVEGLTLSLPAVTKTEFLLTISIQSQVDK